MAQNNTLPVRAETDSSPRSSDTSAAKSSSPRMSRSKNASSKNASSKNASSKNNAAPASAGHRPTTDTRPTTPAIDVVIETKGNEIHLSFDGQRRYRIRGLERNHSSQQLKVNILAAREEGPYDAPLVHLDTLDLFKARSRSSFIKATASELFVDQEIIKRDIGTMLLKLEQLQYERIEAATRSAKPVELTHAEKEAAMKLLKEPDLIGRILQDFDACGLVGEETNKLVCYLACVSRRLANPLALLIQSGSAAGKTTLMDATLAFMPEEDQVRYSAMTGQSLYYMGPKDLKHRILAISEEEGVAQASYALKLLQSDGRLTMAAVGKSQQSGRQTTETYSVEGPVMMFLTTTSEHPDPELQNRCLTLRVNETAAQTAAIHDRQRSAYLRGKAQQAADTIRTLHQNAQRLLNSLPVIMPWAEQLTFRDDQTRMRRDHAKYLSLIASIALLHQHQRPVIELGGGEIAIESTPADVELANRLVSQTMGHSLDDLLPQTRQLLVLIDNWVNQQAKESKRSRRLVRFTQRQLRESFGWSDFQIRHHLKRLVELEYVLVHRTGHGNSREYELLYDGQGRDGTPFLLGLADPEKLKPAKR